MEEQARATTEREPRPPNPSDTPQAEPAERHILCAFDGSLGARAAFGFARDKLASRQRGDSLVLFQAFECLYREAPDLTILSSSWCVTQKDLRAGSWRFDDGMLVRNHDYKRVLSLQNLQVSNL